MWAKIRAAGISIKKQELLSSMNHLKYIKDLLFKYKYRYMGGLVCLLFVDFLQLVLPKFLGNLTDTLESGQITKELLFLYSLGVIGISLGIAVFRFFWRYFVFGVSKILETALRDRFYLHLQKLSVNYYNNHKTGDLMAHATNDINNVRMALGQGAAMMVDSALIPVVAIIMMFSTVGVKLTLACFAPLVLLAVVIGVNMRFVQDRIEKMQEAFSQLTEKVRENFSGIRVVKSFVQEKSEIDSFEEANRYNRDTNLRFAKNMQMIFPLIMAISSLSSAIALLYGGLLVISKEITLGDFVAFNTYLGLLIWPIAALGWVTNMFQRGSVSLKRLNSIMDEKPEIEDGPDVLDVKEIQGKIEFKNLNFTYPGTDRPVLKNINITVEQGKTLAIVGRTGSGKTSLINLISRLYNVEKGTLRIDGLDIEQLPLSTLRSGIGYVPQDSFLFSTTIGENIDFFQGRDQKSIEKAAKLAKVYDNIMDFPDGFNTMVGERGVTLSGGQKQRIAIARAVLREPSILILDDCLSAVDTHTEEEILKGLKEIMKQRTSVIVSHRISTIQDADEIIVLEEGEIVERGTHGSLLEKQGLYYELYQKQLLADQIEGVE